MNTKILLTEFEIDQKVSFDTIKKIRGYLGNRFIENSVFHNHLDEPYHSSDSSQVKKSNQGKFNYSYPLIQYKYINGKFCVLGINEGIQHIYSILPELSEFIVDNNSLKITETKLKNINTDVKISDSFNIYKFNSPYFAFNSENYKVFKSFETQQEQKEFISRVLTGNILTFLKGIGVWIEDKIYVDFFMENMKTVKFKDTKLIGLTGEFATNVELPDYIGLGKSVAKGYGIIVKRI